LIVKNTLRFDAPVDEVWRYVLNNIASIARCIPGAELTTVDEWTYAGKVQVKLGPIRVAFTGTVSIEDLDELRHTARLRAQATEARGLGKAMATVNAAIHPLESGSLVSLESDIVVSGPAAIFGIGRVIEDVSQPMAERFAKCVEQEIKAARAR
jgi:carbon monoxide dehydrogenase subunit G